MEPVIFTLAGLFIGLIAGMILQKKLIKRDFVSAGTLADVNQKLSVLQTEKNMLLENLEKEREALREHNKTISLINDKIGGLQQLLAVRETQKNQTEETLREKRAELEEFRAKHEELLRLMANEKIAHASKIEESKNLTDKLAFQKEELEKLGKKFEDAFGVLAQQILDDKSRKFSEEQERNMKNMLEPLQKEIENFKRDIHEKHKQESDERISLREAVKHITDINKTLSEQAEKLTSTLRLQVKQQGDWGETILETILENSGLQKGLQYFTQHSTRNEDGKLIRPDVVIKYPDQRKIIIDAKVSLVNYYDLCGCAPEEEEIHRSRMIQSFRSHIDGLANRNYADIQGALDFVILFVAVEPAYISAMHYDPALWQYAYQKRILLISPANLVATLKLVEDMWRKDAIDKNAQAIAEKAGKLYDKLESFVQSFERLGEQLQKASGSWDDARKQLISGRGNLLKQAVHMKHLQIGNRKNISEKLEEEAMANAGFLEEED